MNIEINGARYTLNSYCLGNCHITEIALPESGETIARGISKWSSIESETDAIQNATRRLNRLRLCDFERMVGG